MATAPLSQDARSKLIALCQKIPISTLAKRWGIDRRTLAEAFAGLAKRDATRFMIETKIKEETA